MCGATAWMQLKAPVTLVSITSCHASAVPAGADSARGLMDHDIGAKGFEPMFELEHRQGTPHFSRRETPAVGCDRPAGCGRVWCPRPRPRRDDQRRVAARRGGLYVHHRVPLLLEV